jgi:hypothetical protein
MIDTKDCILQLIENQTEANYFRACFFAHRGAFGTRNTRRKKYRTDRHK